MTHRKPPQRFQEPPPVISIAILGALCTLIFTLSLILVL
nr:MAG TPA: hypothetical protein [Caudoviricetes sp.]